MGGTCIAEKESALSRIVTLDFGYKEQPKRHGVVIMVDNCSAYIRILFI